MNYIYLLVVISALQTSSTFACSCEKLKRLTKSELQKGEVIFIGTVIEKTYIDEYSMVTRFAIDEYLGRGNPLTEYEIWSSRDCEPHFKVADKWYIYGNLYREKHWSIICSRSAQLTNEDFSHVQNKYRN